MTMRETLAAAWHKRGLLALLLLPVAVLFALAVEVRLRLYRFGLLRSVRLPVPVVVVGNITAGGSGKTPLALYLAQALARQGRRPGIVSRGYGGAARGVRAVRADSDPGEVGDEPVLLARRAGCPVFVGSDRLAAARALLAAHPLCDVLIADDGLQHYRLARDVEIAVLDGRGLGNGWPLPAGPLRECPRRLAEVDAVVLNGEEAALPGEVRARHLFRMELAGQRFASLREPARTCGVEELRGKRLHALAGTGNPARFFRRLDELGLQVAAHAFPDHHRFRPADIEFMGAEALLMTEKDAVKCRAFAPQEAWFLPVEARLDADLALWVMEKLDGRKAA